MDENKKLTALKRLVGDDVYNSIVSTGKSLEAKAKKQGLKFKEGQNMTEYEEFQEWREFQQFKAAKQSGTAVAELSEDQLDALIAEVEIVEEKAIDYKSMAGEIVKAMEPMIRDMMRKRDEEEEKGKELSSKLTASVDVAGVESLQATINEMQAKINELSQPVVPSSYGFRPSLQHDPREVAKEQTKGYSPNGIDSLAADWAGGVE